MSNGPIEPPADVRAGAANLYLSFTALVQAGFTEQQALSIIGLVMASTIRPPDAQ